MKLTKALIIAVSIALLAAPASADLKIVKMEHTDGFSAMGRETPPMDQEQVTWIGADRLRMNSGSTSTIIRLDQGKLYVLNHDDKTFNTLDLPVDLKKFMPPGMADGMLSMMTFEVTVTPRDETKKVGEWEARRYDVSMVSKMATMESVMWAAKESRIDMDAFYKMYEHLNSMNPGLEKMAQEMRKVDGLVVEQSTVTTMTVMGNTTIKRTEVTKSIEELDAPPGVYDPPADYEGKPFDFMGAMQRQ